MNDESEPNASAAETLFHQALELPDSEQQAFLEEACGDDDALRTRLQHWLQLDAGGYLRKPTMDVSVSAPSADLLLGAMIGPYKVLEQIGEGGGGVVYLAEQREPLTRRVALKVIKLGMDSQQVIARFEAERQALAMMEHPNIAKVLDAGATESGRPYFVMELVRGVPITEYCDQRGFTTDERLTLFQQVCSAVQHAHHKGIIHRDLKPNNILVATNGDQAVPMIIDFGIAKATQGRLTDKTLFTHFHQFIGTPEYMSPEQVQMSNIDVDTRSDIYSLGVLLYELLTGKKPLDGRELRQAGFEEICRRIREETAPKPSKRLTAMEAEELTTLATQRRLTPAQFTSSISGDLDWIVMKAVEKDVSRRYDSCTALAADIERYRKKEPVLAGPPSAIYHLRKFAQRNRAAAFAIIGVALALIVGTSIAVYGLLSAVEGKRIADAARTQAVSERNGAITTAYLADMQDAHEALAENNIAWARRILEQTQGFPPDHDPRHWEWRALWRQCQSESALSFGIEGDHQINSIRVSPDGRWAAVSSRETVRIWDMSDGSLIHSLKKSGGWSQIGVSTDGNTIYVSFEDAKVIRSYQAPSFANPTDLFTLDEHAYQMAISPNGRWLAALCRHWEQDFAQLHIWNLETREPVKSFSGLETGGAGRLDFSKDSRLLGVGLRSNLRVIELETLDDAVVVGTRAALAMTFSPDGTFAASSDGSRLNIHRLVDGELVKQCEEHVDSITDLVYSPDGRFIASASDDQSVILWNSDTYEKLATFRGLNSKAKAVSFTPDSSRLLVAGNEPILHVWDFSEDTKSPWSEIAIQVLAGFSAPYSQFSYSADGTLLAATSHSGVTLRSADTFEITRTLTDSGCGVRCSPVDPNLIAVGFQHDGSLALFQATSGEELRRMTVLPDRDASGNWGDAGQDAHAVFPVQFSKNGERLMVIARMQPDVSKCVIYRVRDLSEVTSWMVRSKEVKSPNAALSPEGTRAFVAGYWGSRMLTPNQSAENAEVLFRDHHTMSGLDFSPDGRVLALGGVNHTIFLLNPNTGETIDELIGHSSGIGALRFSPDSKRLASACSDGVKLWDVATRRKILTLDVESRWIRQLEWSPDGSTILVMSGGGTVRSWRVPSFEEIERERARR